MGTIRQLRPQIEQPQGAVSNHLYDMMTVFRNKLEALAAYDKYMQDVSGDQEARRTLEQISSDDRRHVQMLCDHLEQMCRTGKFR